MAKMATALITRQSMQHARSSLAILWTAGSRPRAMASCAESGTLRDWWRLAYISSMFPPTLELRPIPTPSFRTLAHGRFRTAKSPFSGGKQHVKLLSLCLMPFLVWQRLVGSRTSALLATRRTSCRPQRRVGLQTTKWISMASSADEQAKTSQIVFPTWSGCGATFTTFRIIYTSALFPKGQRRAVEMLSGTRILCLNTRKFTKISIIGQPSRWQAVGPSICSHGSRGIYFRRPLAFRRVANNAGLPYDRPTVRWMWNSTPHQNAGVSQKVKAVVEAQALSSAAGRRTQIHMLTNLKSISTPGRVWDLVQSQRILRMQTPAFRTWVKALRLTLEVHPCFQSRW